MANWKEPPFSKAKMEGIHQRQANRMRTASPAMLKKQTEEYLIVIEREDRKNGDTFNMDYWAWMNTDLNYRTVQITKDRAPYKKSKAMKAKQKKKRMAKLAEIEEKPKAKLAVQEEKRKETDPNLEHRETERMLKYGANG